MPGFAAKTLFITETNKFLMQINYLDIDFLVSLFFAFFAGNMIITLRFIQT